MSFNIGLSGLYAANKQLDVTGNNIANVCLLYTSPSPRD